VKIFLWLLLCLSSSAWAEASYTFEADIHLNGKEVKPRVVTRAGTQAEIKIGIPQSPDVVIQITPRPASSSTVSLEGTVEMRSSLGSWDAVRFRAETRIGDHLRFEFGENSVELRTHESEL
jgi:hypothetical protein